MSEETRTESEQETTEAAPAKPVSRELVMCFVSKKMVPADETVEIEYAPGKKYAVQPKYLRG